METLTTNMTTVLSVITQVLALFSEFPLNLFLVGGLGTMGFGIFAAAKHAARS